MGIILLIGCTSYQRILSQTGQKNTKIKTIGDKTTFNVISKPTVENPVLKIQIYKAANKRTDGSGYI